MDHQELFKTPKFGTTGFGLSGNKNIPAPSCFGSMEERYYATMIEFIPHWIKTQSELLTLITNSNQEWKNTQQKLDTLLLQTINQLTEQIKEMKKEREESNKSFGEAFEGFVNQLKVAQNLKQI